MATPVYTVTARVTPAMPWRALGDTGIQWWLRPLAFLWLLPTVWCRR